MTLKKELLYGTRLRAKRMVHFTLFFLYLLLMYGMASQRTGQNYFLHMTKNSLDLLA